MSNENDCCRRCGEDDDPLVSELKKEIANETFFNRPLPAGDIPRYLLVFHRFRGFLNGLDELFERRETEQLKKLLKRLEGFDVGSYEHVVRMAAAGAVMAKLRKLSESNPNE